MNKEALGYLFQRSNGAIQKVDDERHSSKSIGTISDIGSVVLLQRSRARSIERRTRPKQKEEGVTASEKGKSFSRFGVVFPLPHDHLDDIFLSSGGID
jgi:hypothetical protein